MAAIATSSLRFVLLGDDRASAAFSRFARQVDSSNRALDRNRVALGQQSKASTQAQSGLSRLATVVIGFNDAVTVSNRGSSLFARSLAGINLATGILEPAVASLTVAAGGLAAAFAAGGAGLGAYGLVLGNVGSELKKLKQMEQAAATGSKTAQKALQAYVKALPKPLKDFATQLDKTKMSFGAWADSLEGPVLGPLTSGLKLAAPLLHSLTPLVKSAALAVKFLVSELTANVQAGYFDKLFKTLRPAVFRTIVDAGETLINVFKGLAGILTAFLPVSGKITGGVEKASEAFARWGQTLSSHSGFQSLVKMARQDAPYLLAIFKNVAVILKNVGSNMAGLASPANSKALLQILVPLSKLFAQLSQNQALVQFVLYVGLAKSALGKFGPALTLTGKAFTATSAALTTINEVGLVAWLKNIKLVTIAQKIWNGVQVAFNVIMRANPIILIGTLIVGLVAAVIYAYKHFKWFRDFVNAVWKGILATVKAVVGWFTNSFVPFFTRTIPHAWSAAWNFIKSAAQAAWNFLTRGWGQFLVPGLTVIRKVIELVRDHWKDAWNVIKNAALTAWHFIERFVINPFKAVWSWLKSAWNFVKGIGSFLSGGGGPTNAGAAAAQAYAQQQMPRYGWTAREWPPLQALWQGESGWNRFARNKDSGAYGIPQALPPSKMGPLANPPTSSAAAQINWGMSYIKSRYTSPENAYRMWLSRSPHWYAAGGPITEPIAGVGMRTGRSYGFGERGTEYVAGSDFGKKLDVLAGLVRELIGAVDDNAVTTANGVARAVSGGRGMDYGALYGAR